VKPGLSHALLGLLIWGVVSLVTLPLAPAQAVWFGVTATTAFYVARERRQSEEWFGSNRIPPWRWRPRALRDVAWPVLAVLVATGLLIAADRLAGAALVRAVL
jgi:hypothetical protein